jgi:hypothetical protein
VTDPPSGEPLQPVTDPPAIILTPGMIIPAEDAMILPRPLTREDRLRIELDSIKGAIKRMEELLK